jgi:argininosuccinate lyase
MTGTGRLTGVIGARTRGVVYGELGPADIAAELALTSRVDRAHVVMLAEQNLVSRDAAADLLRCIEELSAGRFSALVSRPAPRGVYLMYEGYLIERLGPDIGGVLHTGRSRNDLKATITKLRLRDWVLEFVEQAARLQAVLLSRARAYEHVVMPVHTHFQAAMPVTYGYYLVGVAMAVSREIEAIRTAADGLRICPLGAAAVAGTDLPIDPYRTASLLGFSATTTHALDTLASRDDALRLLSAAAGLAVTLSRFALDLQLWSTAEFGFVRFPDRLVGGSSAMPQKRNAFLLEHVRAKAGIAIGAWTGAAGAMKSSPFTNSIEVGTEAMSEIRRGLTAVGESVSLCQVLASGAAPVVDRMRARAENGFTAATSLANHLVGQGVPFRTAHHLVGQAVRRAVADGSTSLAGYGPSGWTDEIDLDVAELAAAHQYGGGPGAFEKPFREAAAHWSAHRRWSVEWRSSSAESEAVLAGACASITEECE